MNLSIKKVVVREHKYLSLLKEIPGSPKELYYLGQLPNQEEPTISVVGTRKATPAGILIAKQISRDLVRAGVTVVSGLALGIDGAAHEGALAGGGKTMAVLANGLDTIYPHRHYGLAKKILNQGGCIFSEYQAGVPAYPNQFLERNRIVSGLSTALVVIEAPIRSGSLVTAKHALDQGREVFITPGPASHPNYEGSHLLIRNGARLVTKAKDILEDLNIEPQIGANMSTSSAKSGTTHNLGSEEKLILETVKNNKEPISVDKIIEVTKLETHIVNQKLTFLMLEELVEEKNGKFKSL
ncbi:MAG: DNA-processing protein DprA [Patescibacteria group bacterium]|nr:DNA-processing protein DprA [Patescibacteria group bacterium]